MHPDPENLNPDQPHLDPCPFCGHLPLLLDLRERGHWVECDNPACLVVSETRTCDTPELAAAAWNERAPVPEPT